MRVKADLIELIDLAAEDGATAPQWKLFEKLIISNAPFRQMIRDRKLHYNRYGDPNKADRLNTAMVRVLRVCLTRDEPLLDFRLKADSEQDRDSEEAGVDWDDKDGLFYQVADGEASMSQRNLFRDRLLRNDNFYLRVCNMQSMWASISSQEAQKMAKNLERALNRCDTMRAEMNKDALASGEASRDIFPSIGDLLEGSHVALGGPSRSAEPGVTRANNRPPLRPDESLEEVDLIELVACKIASTAQAQHFASEFKSNKAFQDRVLARDRKYLASNSSENYEKAVTMRLLTGEHGDVQSLHLYPWDHHLVEGFRLFEERLCADRSRKRTVPAGSAEELQLNPIQRGVEASANVSKKEYPRQINQRKLNPGPGSSPRGNQAQEQSPGIGQGRTIGVGLSASEGGSSKRGPVSAEHSSSAERSSSTERSPSARNPSGKTDLAYSSPFKRPSLRREGRPPLHPGPPRLLVGKAGQDDAARTAIAAPSATEEGVGPIARGTPQPSRAVAAGRADAFQAAAISKFEQQPDNSAQDRITKSEQVAGRTAMLTQAVKFVSHFSNSPSATHQSNTTGSRIASGAESASRSAAPSSRSKRRTNPSPSAADARSGPPTRLEIVAEVSQTTHQVPAGEGAPVHSVVSEREMERLHSRIREAGGVRPRGNWRRR